MQHEITREIPLPDDGTVISVKDFPGFAEKVENKW